MKAILKPIAASTSLLYLAACSNGQVRPEADPSADVRNSSGPSVIVSQSETAPDSENWGTFHAYFTQDTHVLSPVLVGTAKLKAGQQIHPPHRHADEEYMMVISGRGTWSLNGQDSPAKTGDILFARAWDYHGIRAAPDSPLEFVVFKYSGREGAAPTDPSPHLPEEAAE